MRSKDYRRMQSRLHDSKKRRTFQTTNPYKKWYSKTLNELKDWNAYKQLKKKVQHLLGLDESERYWADSYTNKQRADAALKKEQLKEAVDINDDSGDWCEGCLDHACINCEFNPDK